MSFLRIIKIGLIWLVSLALVLPVAIAGGLVYLFSAAVRALATLLEPDYAPTWKELIEFDPDLGWRQKADLDRHYVVRKDDIFRIETDGMGWPRKDPLGKEHDVVVFGDSYASGFGIDIGSSFADLTDSPRIKAIGAPGYSMVQTYMLMRSLAPQLSGKLIVWFVYLENDLYDNLFPNIFEYRAPFVRNKNGSDNWEIVDHHISAERWESSARVRPNLDVLAELCTPSPLSDRVYAACEYLIGEANDVCKRAGAQLVVMAIPNLNQLESEGRELMASTVSESEKFDAYYPDERMGEICAQHGVPFVAGSRDLDSGDYKRWERWHWNAKGHAKVADLLAELHTSYRSGSLARMPDSVSEDSDSSGALLARSA